MKIVFLLCSPDISGGTHVILQHGGGLRRLGHEVTIATAERVDPVRYSWHREGAGLRWRTLAEIDGEDFDIAIATWWESPYLLAQMRATHVAYFVQSIESKFFAPDDPRNLDTRDHSIGANRCDNGYFFAIPVITEATWIKDYLATEYNHQPYLVRNGIDKSLYRGVEAIAPRQAGRLRVLVEGPVDVFHKNVPRTIELCRRAGVAEIWLLTSSELKDYPGVARVFSRLPLHETPPVYRSCDVLVKLSYVEGMFGPPLEMFHCGGTAIVYAVTGHDEYLRHGENGLVVEKDDEQGVIECLRRLREEPLLLEQLCLGAMATAAAWPDWTTATAGFAEALQEIVTGRPVSRNYLRNLSETFLAHQGLQLQVRELERFAARERSDTTYPGANDNFVEMYGPVTAPDGSGSPWCHYPCGEKTVVRVPFRVVSADGQLRVDPSVRIGMVRLFGLRILGVESFDELATFTPQNFDELFLTGTGKWLARESDHWVIEAFGNDPQLFLPWLRFFEVSKEYALELVLQEMGMAEYWGNQHRQRVPPTLGKKLLRRLGLVGASMVLGLEIVGYCPASFAGLPVIFDTDISSDVDDIGAVAVLHALANQGQAEILAMMVSAINPSAVGCLHGLNNYFGRPDITVGQLQGEGVVDESRYSEVIAKSFAPRDADKPGEIDALALYRRVLAGQADNSVVVITTGYLTNLRNLLLSPPDGNSLLGGADLVARKVKRLVTMGGQYPKGREWNFYRDAAAAATVVAEWPTEILFVGYEAGTPVLTGSGLAATPEGNPLRLGYQLYNGLSDRSSWDQLTAWYGIAGDDPESSPPLFTRHRGVNMVLDDGSNTWRKDPVGKHAYVRNSLPVEKLSATIENMMVTAVLGGGR